jgi:adenylate cyclase
MTEFTAPKSLTAVDPPAATDDSALASRIVSLVLRSLRNSNEVLTEQRLAEVVAKYIGAVRQARTLEQQQIEMRQFFSPKVVEALARSGPAALEPRQGPVSVLFCDVRGFSRKVEESSDDLHALLARVREALSVMTRNILKHDGVIADFQGDAALGFWGWPHASEDSPALACRAALAIQKEFAEAQRDPFHEIHGFHVGIGICHGEAITGRIGSDEQIKVGVFGPIVNMASRLQDLTKQVGVPILVDGPTADAVADYLPPSVATCRRVTRLRPAGIATPVDVFALSSGRGPGRGRGDSLTFVQEKAYELASEAVESGHWTKAQRLLSKLPAKYGPANFLRRALRDCGQRPPADWDGVLTMDRKGLAGVLAG